MKIIRMTGSWAGMGMRSDFYLPLFSIVLLFTFNPTFILASDITGTNIPIQFTVQWVMIKYLEKMEKNGYGSGGNDALHGDQGDDSVGGDSVEKILLKVMMGMTLYRGDLEQITLTVEKAMIR